MTISERLASLLGRRKKMPEISIILPVYNVDPYLNACLDSLLAQDFTAWEAILVDDGSVLVGITPRNSIRNLTA